MDDLKQGGALRARTFLTGQDIDGAHRQFAGRLPRREIVDAVGDGADLDPGTVEGKGGAGVIGAVSGIALGDGRALVGDHRYGYAHGADNGLRRQGFELVEGHASADHIIFWVALEDFAAHRLNGSGHLAIHWTFDLDHHGAVIGHVNAKRVKGGSLDALLLDGHQQRRVHLLLGGSLGHFTRHHRLELLHKLRGHFSRPCLHLSRHGAGKPQATRERRDGIGHSRENRNLSRDRTPSRGLIKTHRFLHCFPFGAVSERHIATEPPYTMTALPVDPA